MSHLLEVLFLMKHLVILKFTTSFMWVSRSVNTNFFGCVKRSVKAMKIFCPGNNGALKANIAIAYCTHNNSRFGNCGSV